MSGTPKGLDYARNDDALTLVDVGSAGGLQVKWRPHISRLRPVLVEPNPEATEVLTANFPTAIQVSKGLASVDGNRTLHITRNPFCVSILEPNFDLLEQYSIRANFLVLNTMTIPCSRYDTLVSIGEAPAPDFIKIDVQGYEYEVLQGFGGLLQSCIGIELETHLYPIYKDQKLISDIVMLLEQYGLVLRQIKPAANFDGDVVEVDLVFTRRQAEVLSMPQRVRWKFDLITSVCGLDTFPLRHFGWNLGHSFKRDTAVLRA